MSFLDAISGYVRYENGSSATRPIRLAAIDPAHDPYAGVLPKVTFEGEATLSGKRYPFVDQYVPVPNDKVVLIPVGTTYLILGSIATVVLPQRTILTRYLAGATYVPAKGMRTALARCVASGGAGAGAPATNGGGTVGSCGSGGGAGGYAEGVISAETMPASVTVTVGAAAAATTGNGANGNASSFGSLLVCAGGLGGSTRAASATPFGVEGGDGGAVTAGDIRVAGGGGFPGFVSGQLGYSGNGASAPLGGGGLGRATAATTTKLTGGNATGYGAGGGGAFNSSGVTSTTGGNSAPGVVLVYEMF